MWNAVEHGMTERKNGRISVSSKTENEKLTVTVTDDGVGLPENFDISRDQGLGLTIIRNLVERNLDGTFDIKPRNDEPGATARLSFRP